MAEIARRLVPATLGLASIMAGGIIYLLWRNQDILMFSWVDTIGFTPHLVAVRGATAYYADVIPVWFRFSLPNALWLFGGIIVFHSIWEGYPKERLLWVAGFLIVAVGSELGQGLGVIPGTYDNIDMVLMIAFSLLALGIGKTRILSGG